MNESTTKPAQRRFSPRAALAAVGARVGQLNLFAPIQAQVKIEQKVVKHTPIQKLYDGFIAILAGAHGLVEVNKRLRNDLGLQAAFGRDACAEQSVVQDTLDACTSTNVEQMQQAMDTIYRQQSQGYRHDYAHWQLLDIDITGLPCGKKAAFASLGYFARQRNRRGRQLGRVLATWYEEIIVDRLFPGTTQLSSAFQPLVEAAQHTLDLDAQRRQRTILRVDGGGGSVADVNWALEGGYHVHAKAYLGRGAHTLAASVTEWVNDPRIPSRQVGWVSLSDCPYLRPLTRIAVRCRKRNGQWGVGILLSTLSAQDVILLTRQPLDRVNDPTAVLLAYVYFYDQRGGGVETEIKEDKQGLGVTKRNKKRFTAQQMLTQLNALAHNTIVWARGWLAPHCPKIAHWGMLRMVRDVFQVSGLLVFDAMQRLSHICLNQADPLAQGLAVGLLALLASQHVAVTLGET